MTPAFQPLVLQPLQVTDASIASRVREALQRIGYTREALIQAIPEPTGAREWGSAEHTAIAGRIQAVDPLSCLIRAFVLAAPSPEADIRACLGEKTFLLFDQAGLWKTLPEGIVGTAALLPDGGTYLLSDHTSTRLGENAEHWVMGVSTTTLWVLHSIALAPVERALDLCCGGGIIAFHLAQHAKRVVAIDRNERALNFGRFSAVLNQAYQIDFRESDIYSAVAGEQFDLIACNPPFVITPDRQAYYRDGGLGGDRFSEHVIRRASEFLREGGFAHFICDCAISDGGSREERIRSWTAGNGCDVLIVSNAPVTPQAYVNHWLRSQRKRDEEAFAAESSRWLEHFRELAINAIGTQLVVLRKRTGGGPNWFLDEEAPVETCGTFGHQIARRFTSQDLLNQPDTAILKTKWRVAPELQLEQKSRPGTGGWAPRESKISFTDGLIHSYVVDDVMASFLGRLDGSRPLSAVLAAHAAAHNTGKNWAGAEAMKKIRHLAGCGMIEPTPRR